MISGNSAIDNFSMSSQFSQSTDVSTVGGGTLVSEHHQHLPPDQAPPNGNFSHQRHSRVFDAKFAEMSIDNDQTPPPPIPRTTSIKQSIDSRSGGQGQGSSTLLQISQRSSTSSNSSFQESSSSFNNSIISGTNTPMIMRNNSNVSVGGGKPEYFTNADNSPLLMKGTSYHGSNNNNATTPVNQTPGTRL